MNIKELCMMPISLKKRLTLVGLLCLAIITIFFYSVNQDSISLEQDDSCEISLENTDDADSYLRHGSPEYEGYYRCPILPGEGLQQALENRLVPATINKECFRGGLPGPKEDSLRIVFIGDSFTFGLGVADNDTFPFLVGEKLEQTLSCPVQSLNLAVQGYDLNQKVMSLNEKALAYDPDIVIFQLFWDDWYSHKQAQKFLPPVYWLASLLTSPSCMRCNALSNALLGFNTRVYWRTHPHTASALKEKLAPVWEELFEFASQANITLVLLDLGADPLLETLPNAWALSPELYIIPYFPEWETDENIIPGDGHANPSGHRIIADEVISFLQESGLAECKN